MTQLFANNAASKLAGSIGTGATSLTVTSSEGALFPAISGSDFFNLTLFKLVGGVETNIEIIKVTARSSDTMTIVRAQEGTTAKSYSAGDYVQARLTKESMEGLQVAAVLAYILAVVNTWSAAQIGAVASLTSASGSIAVNLSLKNNFSHTLTENTTLANPSNAVAGQSGCIAITQHASAAKTLAFGSNWIHSLGTSNPTMSTTVGAVNLLSYYVVDSTHIWFSLNNHGVT